MKSVQTDVNDVVLEFTHQSALSFVDFEQVNSGWVDV